MNGFDGLMEAYDELLVAAKLTVAQFERIKQHQHEQLVLGQTLESASANWDEATNISLDFQPLMDAIAKAESLL